MSDIIHLLPDSVANQIAAGEVIQRPASVIKELVENAIDAEATEIHVLVTDAGKTCIQVIVDGKGMSETDARLSFERHATSKIREASDLFALRTMGFRGEALASVAAVAEGGECRFDREDVARKTAVGAVLGGVVEQRVGDARAAQHVGLRAQPARERERLVDLALAYLVHRIGHLDRHHAPRCGEEKVLFHPRHGSPDQERY